MNPVDVVKCIYAKDKSVRYVNEPWVGIYLNKVFLFDNAEAISKAIDYHLYISPNSYFYLLYMLIPKKSNYNIRSVKKTEDDEEEDLLVTKAVQILGWSKREYELNKREFTKTILANRDYWMSELAVELPKKRAKK